MKQISIILTLCFLSKYYSQDLIQTEIQNKKVSYFVNLEKKLGNKLYKSNEKHISFRDVEQPIIFERKENNIPNLLVFYTFYKKDSTIAEILYEWDTYNFEKNDNNKKNIKFDKDLIKKYESIVAQISKKHGKSKQDGDLKDIKLLNNYEGLKRSDDWQINDSLKINSYINLSEFYKKDGPVTVNPTHRIRVYVTNERAEKEPVLPKLSPEKVFELDKNFFDFTKKIGESDFKSAREKLSDRIKESATDEVLKSLSDNIKKDKKIENFMTGYQFLMDGKTYPMIQYKYSDDTSNPPKEYIIVIFEDSGKILGIKPMKMLK